MKNHLKGRVTLPAETGAKDTVVELFDRWGADYIRDSDGTLLSPEPHELAWLSLHKAGQWEKCRTPPQQQENT